MEYLAQVKHPMTRATERMRREVSKKETPRSGKAGRSHNRLQAVLDAGAKLFATKGYKATTMRDIASEAGMLPGSLYYHFESKQDLK